MDDIEVLRAVAILLTIAIHAVYLFPEWNSAAIYQHMEFRVGVDLFFVISGFVITRSALPHLSARHDARQFWRNASAFWVRRAWRIWPSSWLWLALITACTLLLNESGVFGTHANLVGLAREVTASLLQVMNLSLLDSQFLRPGSTTTSTGATFPYWSLSLEEQFYLAFPLLILVARKRLAAVLLLATAVMFSLPKGVGQAWFFLRYDGIMIGVLLAIWKDHASYRRFEPKFLKHGAIRQIGFLAGTTLGITAVAALDVRPATSCAALLCGVLVFAGSFGKNYLFPAGKVRDIMIWIGSRSYAIYLCHALLFQVTREIWFRLLPSETRGTDYVLLYAVTAAVLVGVASELNFRFVERPLRVKGRRIAEAMEQGAGMQSDKYSSRSREHLHNYKTRD